MAGEVTTAREGMVNPINALGGGKSAKARQLSIILANNPADESLSYHTWIRGVNDIHTFKEAMVVSGYTSDDDFTPDFKSADVKKALQSGKVTVYSSKPIKQGIFVSPSRMEAQNYAGGSKVYSKSVSLADVAWIDGIQGQYAKYK